MHKWGLTKLTVVKLKHNDKSWLHQWGNIPQPEDWRFPLILPQMHILQLTFHYFENSNQQCSLDIVRWFPLTCHFSLAAGYSQRVPHWCCQPEGQQPHEEIIKILCLIILSQRQPYLVSSPPPSFFFLFFFVKNIVFVVSLFSHVMLSFCYITMAAQHCHFIAPSWNTLSESCLLWTLLTHLAWHNAFLPSQL